MKRAKHELIFVNLTCMGPCGASIENYYLIP